MSENSTGASAPVSTPAPKTSGVYGKLAMLFLFIVILLIPLILILDLVQERAERRDLVVQSIGEVWGAPQSVIGPILIIPYTYEYTAKETVDLGNGKTRERDVIRQATANIHVLPESLDAVGKINPEERHKGIYTSTVYTAALSVSGTFDRPNLDRLGIDIADVKWSEAVLALGLSDPRSANSGLTLTWGDDGIPFEPQTTKQALLGAGIHAPVPLDLWAPETSEPIDFSFNIKFAGHKRLTVAPVGKVSRVEMTSPWPHPSFDGAYLPIKPNISADGFEARWEISYLGRGYPQVWTDQHENKAFFEDGNGAFYLSGTSLGLSLVTPVDFYLKSERSVKHGVLFIVLVFAAIFVFEVMTGAKFHPIQYGLMGGALVLFYLLLLSLAEVIGFGPAYGVAAVMATGMIALYFGKILGSLSRGVMIAPLLGLVYGYLYVILQLEDLALLVGALGLFATLAAIMYVTRNVDWSTFTDTRHRSEPNQPVVTTTT